MQRKDPLSKDESRPGIEVLTGDVGDFPANAKESMIK